ncbi:MAG: hypothetical protein U1F77_11430 [Kiritimatiellia bacterium]
MAAESQGAFAGSLWYTHEQGPPRVVAAAPKFKKPVFEDKPLAMTFHQNPAILPFDAQPENRTRIAYYRFNSPPGLRGVTIQVAGKATLTAAGRPLKEVSPGVFQVEKAEPEPVPVLITVTSEAGAYGGAAIPEYIKLDCGPGKFQPGDWAKNDGLLSYSGGATYRKTVDIPKAAQVTLDLGNVVASAELRVNGRPAGVRVAPPWTFDLSGLVQPGENRLEVLVFNTLANHYTSIPTKYLGPTTAGLLGPVTLRIVP